MHHSWWSCNKTATPRRRENPKFSREIELIDSDVWVWTTTLLCSIFLPVLVKAILCIGKDLGMSTVAYASLTVELQQDGYTSKTRESHFRGTVKWMSIILRIPQNTSQVPWKDYTTRADAFLFCSHCLIFMSVCFLRCFAANLRAKLWNGCTVSWTGSMTVAHPSKYFTSTLKKLI